jgi:hypothetical protein
MDLVRYPMPSPRPGRSNANADAAADGLVGGGGADGRGGSCAIVAPAVARRPVYGAVRGR